MGIMGDILDVTADGGRDGIIVSAISRKANLSHYAVLDKCDKLVEAGLVESVRNDRNRVYLITEKGLQFFQEFKKFQGLVESMNLRYLAHEFRNRTNSKNRVSSRRWNAFCKD